MNETVSIIVPVYGAEATLRRCVESLVNGTCKDLEILLIEDCSRDGSWELCQQLARQYPCVRAFRNSRNSGPSVTRNRGLQEMTGKYLMFVDSDDWVEPDFVETFVTLYGQHQPDLLVCGFRIHDEFLGRELDYCMGKDLPEVSADALKPSLPELYHQELLQPIWNKFFLADIVRKNGLAFDPAISIGEDFRFLLSYMEKLPGDKLIRINRPLYHYIRCNKDSLMSHVYTESFDEALKNMDRLYRFMGLEDTERQQRLEEDRQKRLTGRVYLIMHSGGLTMKEKKQRILEADPVNGKQLYRQARIMLLKERAAILLRKIGLKR